METGWTIREPATEADYQRAIDEMLKEMDRIDERIIRHQAATERSRERTLKMLEELRTK